MFDKVEAIRGRALEIERELLKKLSPTDSISAQNVREAASAIACLESGDEFFLFELRRKVRDTVRSHSKSGIGRKLDTAAVTKILENPDVLFPCVRPWLWTFPNKSLSLLFFQGALVVAHTWGDDGVKQGFVENWELLKCYISEEPEPEDRIKRAAAKMLLEEDYPQEELDLVFEEIGRSELIPEPIFIFVLHKAASYFENQLLIYEEKRKRYLPESDPEYFMQVFDDFFTSRENDILPIIRKTFLSFKEDAKIDFAKATVFCRLQGAVEKVEDKDAEGNWATEAREVDRLFERLDKKRIVQPDTIQAQYEHANKLIREKFLVKIIDVSIETLDGLKQHGRGVEDPVVREVLGWFDKRVVGANRARKREMFAEKTDELWQKNRRPDVPLGQAIEELGIRNWDRRVIWLADKIDKEKAKYDQRAF
jgi:hypothetical protein